MALLYCISTDSSSANSTVPADTQQPIGHITVYSFVNDRFVSLKFLEDFTDDLVQSTKSALFIVQLLPSSNNHPSANIITDLDNYK